MNITVTSAQTPKQVCLALLSRKKFLQLFICPVASRRPTLVLRCFRIFHIETTGPNLLPRCPNQLILLLPAPSSEVTGRWPFLRSSYGIRCLSDVTEITWTITGKTQVWTSVFELQIPCSWCRVRSVSCGMRTSLGFMKMKIRLTAARNFLCNCTFNNGINAVY